MIEAITLWNEPNNLSHWDFTLDPDWGIFSEMAGLAAEAIRSLSPNTDIVLGGISPIDAQFMTLLKERGLLNQMDAVAVHGFPLDWNHWSINQWPEKVKEIEDVSGLPVWVTEVGASSFGADEVQLFGLQRTTELLLNRIPAIPRIFWYSLLDLPPAWPATTRHKEAEGSAYYRHYYMGLFTPDGSAKLALKAFNPEFGICQWFHFGDPRLDFAIERLRNMKVSRLRTGLSWADWHQPNAEVWFDHQMEKLSEFDVTLTLCFTPPSRGIQAHHTSPPVNVYEFADFARWVTRRYLTPVSICEHGGEARELLDER